VYDPRRRWIEDRLPDLLKELQRPLDSTTRLALLQILKDRSDKKPVIITSQLPVAKWHEFIGEH